MTGAAGSASPAPMSALSSKAKDRPRTYIAIDLKSFYASVECHDRGLDPLTTNLVVADTSRTEKTICLAVSPSLKSYGIPGRARLFEVIEAVKRVNAQRSLAIHYQPFRGSSWNNLEVQSDPTLMLDYIAATPRMQKYEEVSAHIYSIYLRYIAPEDIHVYSIDEVFMDVTDYLKTYNCSAHDLAMKMIHEVLEETGITATAGIAPNLFLCKVAMDIVAKHIPADQDGVRIAELDEAHYRRVLWNHRPLTDFWRVGMGIARKLEQNGMFTMGDIARRALENEDSLFKLFGVNAEYLIDHAFGRENTTIRDIKAYKPSNNSVGSGQVLGCPYDYDKARIIVREMTDLLVLDLVDRQLVTNQMGLVISYDRTCLERPEIRAKYKGPVTLDYYGRPAPKAATGSINLGEHTSSTRRIMDAMMELYDRIVDPNLLVRRVNVTANNTIDERTAKETPRFEQMDLFTNYEEKEETRQQNHLEDEREKRAQKALLELKKKFGKNAVLRGTDLQEGATMIERNQQIGGHKA